MPDFSKRNLSVIGLIVLILAGASVVYFWEPSVPREIQPTGSEKTGSNATGITEEMRKCQNTSDCGVSACGAINQKYRKFCNTTVEKPNKTAVCEEGKCTLVPQPTS